MASFTADRKTPSMHKEKSYKLTDHSDPDHLFPVNLAVCFVLSYKWLPFVFKIV